MIFLLFFRVSCILLSLFSASCSCCSSSSDSSINLSSINFSRFMEWSGVSSFLLLKSSLILF